MENNKIGLSSKQKWYNVVHLQEHLPFFEERENFLTNYVPIIALPHHNPI